MMSLAPVFFGGLILSLVHVSIPNHWLPFIAIGKTERWSRNKTLGVTAVAGVAHTLSTILIGLIIGVLGYTLTSTYSTVTTVVAPLILAGIGLAYLILDWRAREQHHSHHHHFNDTPSVKSQKGTPALVLSLCIAMFFSPCIEIEAYYFSASALGWLGILTVSVTYFVISVAGMVALVWAGLRGIERFNVHFLEHHEKQVSGLVLIILGLIAFVLQ